MRTETVRKSQTKEDVWIHTICDMCFSQCPIKVHRADGVALKIEGDPEGPYGNGRICAKGHASLMSLYDPNRVARPLKRTNPQKGFGVDPGWQEISWDEALDIIAEKLKRIQADDPRKLVMATFDRGAKLLPAWSRAFGTPNAGWWGYYCGNSLHNAMYLSNGTFSIEYDIDNCKYVILEGTQTGFMAGMGANIFAQKMAEARMRGMKVVVVDPICTNAAAKADEWIPIRPGTDGAWFLGLINVLVNELGLFDAEFIKKRTNGPYLVGPDGLYVKDGPKPLVWDVVDGVAKPFDGDVKDCALDGVFSVRGVECRPSFHHFKESAKRYSPEVVSRITTIPAETVRRIAREFGEAASIGSTVVVEGREIPYRPVAISTYRGIGQHKYGMAQVLALQALQMVVGNFYVVGGHIGLNLIGPGESWKPHASSDGMILPPTAIGEGVDYYDFEVERPLTLGLNDLMPISTNRSAMVEQTIMDPERFQVPYKPEMLILCRRSLMRTNAAPNHMAEMMRRVPFIVYFTLDMDEQAEFADIVLPEQHSLEKLSLFLDVGDLSVQPITDYYYWFLRQPVVEPLGEARNWIEVLLELADRAGFLDEVYRLINMEYRLKGQYRLEPKRRYSLAEIYDRQAKSTLGDEMNLDWFKEQGCYKVKRSVVERYPGPFISPRFPIYFENILRAGKEVRKVADQIGLKWDTSDYEAMLNWRPCPAFSEEEKETFYAVNYKLPVQAATHTSENPWLNEIIALRGRGHAILMNTKVAKKHGIKDGDTVRLDSEAGSVTGTVKVTAGVHPEVLGIAGAFGGWAKGRPIAKGKGVHWNSLVSIDLEHTSPLSGGLDSCTRVEVTKVHHKR